MKEKKPVYITGINLTLRREIWDAIAIMAWDYDEDVAKFIFDEVSANPAGAVTIYGLTREEINTMMRALKEMAMDIHAQAIKQTRYDYTYQKIDGRKFKREEVKGA